MPIRSVPTLEIVNEILENFIDGNQTPTAAQRPQIQKAVYLRLAQATNSFAQPYVLPIRQIETYLSHFQLTRAQLAKSLELDADTTARARLGLSLVERIWLSMPVPANKSTRYLEQPLAQAPLPIHSYFLRSANGPGMNWGNCSRRRLFKTATL